MSFRRRASMDFVSRAAAAMASVTAVADAVAVRAAAAAEATRAVAAQGLGHFPVAGVQDVQDVHAAVHGVLLGKRMRDECCECESDSEEPVPDPVHPRATLAAPKQDEAAAAAHEADSSEEEVDCDVELRWWLGARIAPEFVAETLAILDDEHVGDLDDLAEFSLLTPFERIEEATRNKIREALAHPGVLMKCPGRVL